MSLMEKCKRWYWSKQNYQFGAPIVALYAYQNYLVVATKTELYISPDGVTYQKVEISE